MVVILPDRKVQVLAIHKATHCFLERYYKLRAQYRSRAVWIDSMGDTVYGVDDNVSVEYMQKWAWQRG